MKRFLLFFIVILIYQSLYAGGEKFRILYLNTPTITIGGKALVTGNDFSATDIIKWGSAKQAMRIISLVTNKQLTLSASIVSEKKSLADFFRNRKQLATRPGYPSSLVGISNALQDTLYILDAIEIRTSVSIDSCHFFYASYIKDGNTINKRLPILKEGGFAIDRSLWVIDEIHYTPSPITVSIHYFNTIENKVTDITNGILIVPLDL